MKYFSGKIEKHASIELNEKALHRVLPQILNDKISNYIVRFDDMPEDDDLPDMLDDNIIYDCITVSEDDVYNSDFFRDFWDTEIIGYAEHWFEILKNEYTEAYIDEDGEYDMDLLDDIYRENQKKLNVNKD